MPYAETAEFFEFPMNMMPAPVEAVWQQGTLCRSQVLFSKRSHKIGLLLEQVL
jgi:hypothetical protein